MAVAQDSFTLASGGSLSGVIDGSGGADTLTGRDEATTWTINGSGAGNVYGTSFSNIEHLNGGSAADSFNLGGTMSGTIHGNDGDDIFNISTNQSGTLLGGAGNDVFNFIGNVAVTGLVDGGDHSSNDTLDYSAYTGANVTINLETGAATGTGGIVRIEHFIGRDDYNTVSTADDTIIGENNENTWNITGGTANDTVIWGGNYTISGNLDGTAGTDTIDYTLYSGALSINLTTGSATGILGSLLNFEFAIEPILATNDPSFNNAIFGNYSGTFYELDYGPEQSGTLNMLTILTIDQIFYALEEDTENNTLILRESSLGTEITAEVVTLIRDRENNTIGFGTLDLQGGNGELKIYLDTTGEFDNLVDAMDAWYFRNN